MTYHQSGTASGPREPALPEVEPIAPLDVAAMLRVLWRGKMLILGAMCVVVALATIYAFRLATPQYAAVATVHLEEVAGSDTAGQIGLQADTSALNTKVARATSDTVLVQVVHDLELLTDQEFNRYLVPQNPMSLRSLRTQLRHLLAGTAEEAPNATAVLNKTVQNLRDRLTVARHADSYILHITARSGDPDKATAVANATARAYLAHMRSRGAEAQIEAERWLQSRIDSLQSDIETQEMQIAALIATAQLQEDRGLDTLSARVLAADQNLSEARMALVVLQEAPQRGTPRHAAALGQLRDEIDDLAALRDRLHTQLTTQSAGQAELHQLQLQMDASRQLYQDFLARLHERQMQGGLAARPEQRIAPAVDAAYIGPRKILILVIAGVLGIALGVAAVAARQIWRKGIVDAANLEDIAQLPVLAQLSARSLRQLSHGTQAFPLPPSPLLRAAHNLQTALTLQTHGHMPKLILSTSSLHGEGKCEHAILLAHVMAQAGKRIALVDLDGADPLIRTLLGPTDYRAARDTWLTRNVGTHRATLGVDVVPMAGVGDDQAPLLSQDRIGQIRDVSGQYDHIILNGPPALHGPEAALMALEADAVIYAVRWSKTPREVVLRGLATLEAAEGPATGLILSRINLRKMRKLSADPDLSALQVA